MLTVLIATDYAEPGQAKKIFARVGFKLFRVQYTFNMGPNYSGWINKMYHKALRVSWECHLQVTFLYAQNQVVLTTVAVYIH